MTKPTEIILPKITPEEQASAIRFIETTEDGEGYDVPKPMMKRLAELGLVIYKGFGVYEGTPDLDSFQEQQEAIRKSAPAVKRLKP